MRNLLVITQKVDEDDDLLGFFVAWLKEFSKKFNKVFVITLAKGKYELPPNVFIHSLGKEKGEGKILKIIKFYWHLIKLVPRSSGVFVHMSPIFAIASWPITFLFRKKIILWYLHRSVTFRLKLAEKLCYKIVTSTKESLNIKSKKIVEAGHGIKIERFKVKRSWQNESGFIKILSVGRISKIKDYETLIRVAGILKESGLRFNIKIVGRPVMPYDFEYFERLKKMVGNLGLKDFVEFIGFIPYSQIADYYKDSDIFINLAPRGGIDKAVLEAMASGSLVLVSNEAFKKYFGDFDRFLIFRYANPDDLSEKIKSLLKLPREKLRSVSTFLQESVGRDHNLSDTIDKISRIIQ